MTYASFWKRTAAYVVDGFICQIITFIVSFIAGFVMGMSGNSQAAGMVGGLIGIAVWLIYFVWPESSSWQATIGKRLFGLKVTDANGGRISFLRSLGRYLSMILSAIILFIGYLMCLWTDKKQCLHDKVTNCYVIDTTPNEKQGCVIGVLVCTVLLMFFVPLVLGIVAAIAMPQYFKAVEQARARQTIILMDQVRNAQRQYKVSHGEYTTHWDELTDFAPCANAQTSACEINGFSFEFENQQGIAAQRSSGQFPYRLFRAYSPADQRRDLVCISQDETAKSFCTGLIQHPDIRR